MSSIDFHDNVTFCEYDQQLFELWSNGSTMTNWSDWQLLDYGCSYRMFKKFQKRVDYFRTVLYFAGGCVGIFSSLLALLTFSWQKREFAAVSFSYHRAINLIELPFMLLMIEHAVRDYTSPSFLHSLTWATFFTKVGGRIDNVLPTSVNTITLFIAVERAVACLAPKQFPTINRPLVVWLVVVGSFSISIFIWAPSSFAHTIMYDNRSQPVRYMPVWTHFGKSAAYRFYEYSRHVLILIGAGLMVMATVSAVVGLRRTAARSMQRRESSRSILAGGAPTGQTNVNQQQEYWSLLKNLSYLQLCETVPLIFLHAFLVLTESISWDYKGGGQMAPFDSTYSEAVKNLGLARSRQHAAACLDVSNVAAHCFHFYWYLIFCPKVRHGFVACLRYGSNSRGQTERRQCYRKYTASNSGGQQPSGKELPTVALKEPLLSKALSKIKPNKNRGGSSTTKVCNGVHVL